MTSSFKFLFIFGILISLIDIIKFISSSPTSAINNNKPLVLVPVADDTELVEMSVVLDVLRRGGAQLILVSCQDRMSIKTNVGVTVKMDKKLGSVKHLNFDAVVIPGGYGSQKCGNHEVLYSIIKETQNKGGVIAAICGAPAWVLHPGGFLDKANQVTGYPGTQEVFAEKYVEDKVVVSGPNGRIITSKSPGTSFEFAFKVLEIILSQEVASRVANEMVYS
ncbi:DJ-1 family protein [Cryptosporidium serpentis]